MGAKETEAAMTKNARRRAAKKAQKKEDAAAPPKEAKAEKPTSLGAAELAAAAAATAEDVADADEVAAAASAIEVQVEYVSADVAVSSEELAEFQDVFSKFTSVEDLCTVPGSAEAVAKSAKAAAAKKKKASGEEDEEGEGGGDAEGGAEGDDADGADADGGEHEMSAKARKKASRLSVAELKQLVHRPDVVEAHDVTAADPRLLVYLKAYRNSVPVPRHWCHKRKYLQGKRGVEKAPWQLPEFIAQTGIEKIRTAVEEQEAMKKAKQKSRERTAPKMAQIDIDYQVLHDAFFKWQEKPTMCAHGDIYYEGKEFEIKLKEKKPGNLSVELKQALGMPDGGATVPPPWLINMQRYGPPAAYPNLRIPGLNAPLPEGASFGYHPGGWGKPPVNEFGQPLYGDVFGTVAGTAEAAAAVAAIDKTRWGEMADDEEEEDSDEEEDEGDDDDDGQTDATGMATPLDSGMSSVTSGIDSTGASSVIDLRKRAGMETPDTSGIDGRDSLPPPREKEKELYTVLGEQRATGAAATGGAGALFGSDKRYAVPTGGGNVELSLAPDELDELGDRDALASRYEAQLEANAGAPGERGDSNDDDVARRKRKLERAGGAAGGSKKPRDFKF